MRKTHETLLGLAFACSALGAAALAGSGCERAPQGQVRPERKALVVAAARVHHLPSGPEVRVAVELAQPSELDPAKVDSMRLYRAAIDDVNPMRDHVRGPFEAPLGWDPGAMKAVAVVAGPAGAHQDLIDRTAVRGQTYAYRVGYAMGLGVEHRSPIAVVRVHDPETWWPTDKVSGVIEAMRKAWPERLRVETIGRGAHQGLPIVALRAGSQAPEAPTLVVVGCVHAGESGPELLLPALGEILERARPGSPLGRALQDIALYVVPILNVDERDRLLSGHPTYLRKNPQGIDLNRNFSAGWDEVSTSYGTTSAEPWSWTFRGAEPFSAIEARALRDALASVHVAALLSYHWLYSLTGPELEQPKLLKDGGGGKGGEVQRGRQAGLAAAWFAGLGRRTYPVTVKPHVVDASPSGSLVTWAYVERGAPAFEVEASGDPRLEALATSPPSLELLTEYQARHTDALEAVLTWLAP
jgi:hypothetical protein